MEKVVFTGSRLFMKFPNLEYFEKRLKEIDCELVEVRDADDEALKTQLKNAIAVALIARNLNAEIIGAMERCRIILTLSVGYDCVDVAAATAKLIPVCNTPAYCTDEVANHAITLLLSLARKIHLIVPKSREAVWDYKYTKPIFNFKSKILGIVGLGRVGRALVPKAKGFGMKICAYDPYVEDDIFALLGIERKYELTELLKEADYVSIHTPLTPETYHMIDAAALARMKEQAIIINTARGPIIDEEALADTLDSGKIAAAGIDVLETEPPGADNPLLSKQNALVTPHVAWYSEEAFEADMVDGMDELERVLQGKRPRFIVNPEIFGRRK
ncbi:MAG: C-terminal binding protein [Spirochaetaceae bacterium]|nr:MAG: C-terminal binding protein [Spirochaetaceae bacterium]